MEQVSADLKIQLVFSTPGVPRGRGRIERFFATLAQMFLCDLPGYSPPNGAMRGKPALTLDQLDSLGQAQIMSFELIPLGPLNPLRKLPGMTAQPQ